MKRRSTLSGLALSLAIASVPVCAPAQEMDGDFYDGTWTVRLRCPDGSACTARLVIKDFAGTWQNLSGKSSAKSFCGSKKLPITVQSSTPSLLALTAFGDVVSPTCPTLTVVVKPIDAKALEGTVDTNPYAAESPEIHSRHAGPSQAASNAGTAPGNDSPTARPIRLDRLK
jgi:hypothetical protein